MQKLSIYLNFQISFKMIADYLQSCYQIQILLCYVSFFRYPKFHLFSAKISHCVFLLDEK